jgi:hypothetical protein
MESINRKIQDKIEAQKHKRDSWSSTSNDEDKEKHIDFEGEILFGVIPNGSDIKEHSNKVQIL